MNDITVITPSLPSRGDMRQEAIFSVAQQTLSPHSHRIGIDYAGEGPYAVINRLMRGVETEFFVWLPDDDLWHEKHLDHLRAHIGGHDFSYSEGKFFGSSAAAAANEQLYWGELDPAKFIAKKDQGLRGAHFLMRTEVFEELGPLVPWHPVADWLFLCKVLDAGKTWARVDEYTWDYRQHDHTLSAQLGRGEKPLWAE